MSLDITYGNMSQEEADRLGQASVMPVDASIAGVAQEKHQPGDTEPWISRLVGDLIVARGARTVLETGCFTGATSVFMVDALRRLGGGYYWGCEIDPARAEIVRQRLAPYEEGDDGVDCSVLSKDVLEYLTKHLNAVKLDLVWVDDDHTKPHVTKELQLLYPKMNRGGLILLHDVYGVCDLRTVAREFGGYSIDLPRLGPAGGLGIIQV